LSGVFNFSFIALGSIDYLWSHPDTHELPAKINEATAGLVFGTEFEFMFLSLSFEYAKGFFSEFNMIDDSSFKSFSMNLGFSF